MIDFIYKNLTQEDGRQYAEVKPINVRKLPIPNNIKELGIGIIVDEIIRKKLENQDTNELEERIEIILQKFYNLSDEEIDLIYNQ